MPIEDEFSTCPQCGYPSHVGHGPECSVEQGSKRNILDALALIKSMGGELDSRRKAYKQFNAERHERFLIQRGKMDTREVVFKVAKSKDRGLIESESRNLRVIERAPVKTGAVLDVHFVRQVGDMYSNDHMSGLATEYVQDDPELKRQLLAVQKNEIIGRVINSLQKLQVTETAKESGLSTHNGEKIVSDAAYYLSQLAREGFIGDDVAEKLRKIFERAKSSLVEEDLVFVHGDAHGDNIFVNKNDDGGIDITLLDFEGLRISNRYHDWAEILNKSDFFKDLQKENPEVFKLVRESVENMWLDESVNFDESVIIDRLTKGNAQKAENFRLTRLYDMLSRIILDKQSSQPIAQQRMNTFLRRVNEAVQD